MKQFVFGLGNPGEKYAFTRHNVGVMVLEYLVKQKTGQDFAQVAQTQAKFYASSYRFSDIFFAMPQTYMNDSGKAVRALVEYFDKPTIEKLSNESAAGTASAPSIIVLYDDLDIPLGQFKIQFGKGPKVHNGTNSVRQYLGSDQFLHVRIGIDGRNGQRLIPGSDYVLGQFLPEEQVIIQQVIAEIGQRVLPLLQ